MSGSKNNILLLVCAQPCWGSGAERGCVDAQVLRSAGRCPERREGVLRSPRAAPRSPRLPFLCYPPLKEVPFRIILPKLLELMQE